MNWGIIFMGIIMGYVLYYAIRHTDKFDVTLLSAIAGLIGGGAIPAHYLNPNNDLTVLGPIYTEYGAGLMGGFFIYLAITLLITFIPCKGDNSANDKMKKKFLSSALLGLDSEKLWN